MPLPRFLLPALLLAAASRLAAAVVGTNPPALSLTAERVAALPAAERAPWQDYLERSQRRHEADQAFVAAELKAAGLQNPVMPPEGFGRGTMPLDRAPEWYATAFALQSADAIVSYQLPNGGWGKNLAMHGHLRKPGESFIANNLSRYLAPDDYDTPRDRYWNYFGTLDNDATTTQLRFLAHVVTAVGPQRGAAYRAAFVRGIEYLLDAQYPNGGWPQVWPLEGGYHDAITFNDNAVNQAVEVLQGVAEARPPYAFAPAELRSPAAAAAAHGIACILDCQIRVHGQLTVWCQQHDPLTLQPTSARNFEPPALCSEESAHVVEFLLSVPDPGSAVVASVHAAAAWFKQTAIRDVVWQRSRGGRPRAGGAPAAPAGPPPANPAPAFVSRLVPTPGAGPIWARYYDPATGRPVFGDRDKSVHDQVTDLSAERQRGYQWYGNEPKAMLEAYAAWSAKYPAAR
ncbi:MAG TPA: pectate lyase [Opitutaceae bacterium]|jgi:PelA/Pel-15E family pectate lyase|nr:pectate lyase [Opitutaceae bacterium]